MSRVSAPFAGFFRQIDRLRRRSDVPVVVGVDVEPDRRVFGRDERCPWLGFERLAPRIPRLRERLAEITEAPVAFTWFLRMDPQVAEAWGSAAFVAEEYGEVLEEFVESGDELGLHTHTWRWDESAGEWIADYSDLAYAEHCVEVGLEAFEAAFGQRCRVHRGGDHYLNGAMLAALEAGGVEADLTVEPGWPPAGPPGGERSTGVLPSYETVPTRPYRSSPARFPEPNPEDPRGPLLMPLFSPPALRVPHRTPLPPDSAHFMSRLAYQMTRETPVVMPLVMRSDAALGHGDRLTENLVHLARHGRMEFLTATAAAERVAPQLAGVA